MATARTVFSTQIVVEVAHIAVRNRDRSSPSRRESFPTGLAFKRLSLPTAFEIPNVTSVAIRQPGGGRRLPTLAASADSAIAVVVVGDGANVAVGERNGTAARGGVACFAAGAEGAEGWAGAVKVGPYPETQLKSSRVRSWLARDFSEVEAEADDAKASKAGMKRIISV